MCAYDVDQPHEFAQFGTMLQIKKIEAMADGSCLLETKGLKRFRVLSRGVLDGYCTASVEWIVDESLTSLSIEEQFECVSAMLTPSAPSRALSGSGAVTGAGAGLAVADGAVTPFTAAVAGAATPAAASVPTAAAGAGSFTPTGTASAASPFTAATTTPFAAATTTPAARAAAALPSVPPAPPATTPAVGKGAPSLLSDWEAEMQAELGH
jgi:hypothetical protein